MLRANPNRHRFWPLRALAGDKRGLPVSRWCALALLMLASAALFVRLAWDPTPVLQPGIPIPAAEFSRLFHELSEPDGFFRSDNFISNETSYLHVLPLLRELGISGGVYLGVGPEQNFTYIAKIKPELAFIIDIRRQGVLQHLLYKAVFQLSDSRLGFLATLLSRPADEKGAPSGSASLPVLMDYFSERPYDSAAFDRNLAAILQFIQRDCQIPLTASDVRSIQLIYSAFRDGGLDIRYRVGRINDFGSANPANWYGVFPSFAEVLTSKDLNGRMDGFLASDEDFQFVKELHRCHRIIPVVGDFAGPHALRAIGDFLNEKGLQISAFYVSNVEQYLFQSNTFDHFARSVQTLTFAERSVFIRAVAGRRYQHPANVPGHRLTTILQNPQAFLSAYSRGDIRSYWELVTTDFIAARAAQAGQKNRLNTR